MSSVDDVATLDELAVRVGSRERAVELLARLNVPVTEGVFSDRLFRSRLEQGERASQDPVDAAANHLARLGLIAARVDRGHPTVLTMTAAYPLALGFLTSRKRIHDMLHHQK